MAPDFQPGLRVFADDLAGFLDGLGLESAHFVMAEFATAVALDFANAHPDRIRSLTLPGFAYNWPLSQVDWQGWARQSEEEGSEAWARATNHLRLPAGSDPAMVDWYVTQQARIPGWFPALRFLRRRLGGGVPDPAARS